MSLVGRVPKLARGEVHGAFAITNYAVILSTAVTAEERAMLPSEHVCRVETSPDGERETLTLFLKGYRSFVFCAPSTLAQDEHKNTALFISQRIKVVASPSTRS